MLGFKMLFVSILILCSFLSTSLAATTPRLYLRVGNENVDSSFVVDGEALNTTDFRSRKLEKAMSSNSVALEYLHKGHHYHKISTALFWSSLGVIIIGGGVSLMNDNRTDYWLTVGGGLGMAVASSIYEYYSTQEYIRATNIFNGVPADQARWKINWGISPSRYGGTLGAKLTF